VARHQYAFSCETFLEFEQADFGDRGFFHGISPSASK
jgi:hypothetical protein